MGVLYIHFEEYLPVEFGAIKVQAVVCVCVNFGQQWKIAN